MHSQIKRFFTLDAINCNTRLTYLFRNLVVGKLLFCLVTQYSENYVFRNLVAGKLLTQQFFRLLSCEKSLYSSFIRGELNFEFSVAPIGTPCIYYVIHIYKLLYVSLARAFSPWFRSEYPINAAHRNFEGTKIKNMQKRTFFLSPLEANRMLLEFVRY